MTCWCWWQGFQSRIEVHNFPLESRSEDKLKQLKKVMVLRSIDIAEKKVGNHLYLCG